MRAREPALFSGTIRDNIAGWRDVSDEEVAAAAAAANAAGFIARAPDGYATQVLCWFGLTCMLHQNHEGKVKLIHVGMLQGSFESQVFYLKHK